LNSATSHYLIPADPGRGRALALAALVHFLLLIFLWFGVSWQSDTPTEVQAEIWSPVAREAAPPPPPPLAKPIQESPKPVATVTPPTPPAPTVAQVIAAIAPARKTRVKKLPVFGPPNRRGRPRKMV
jgi:colicin import membrane protein